VITAIFDLAAESLKAFNLIEGNMNRPDMIAAAIAKVRQKSRDAVDKAQAVLQDTKASQADKNSAFEFIRRIES
jgi:hypothetical protein